MKRYVFLSALLLWLAGLQAQQWKNYTNSSKINCILIDHDTLWAGTDGGVAKFLNDGTLLSRYTHAEGLAGNRVNAIAIDSSGNKWFACGPNADGGSFSGGLSKFDGTTWTTFDTSNSAIPSSAVTSVAIDQHNNVWVTMHIKGVARFDGVNWTSYNTTNSILPSNYVNKLVVDKIGNVWSSCFNSSADFIKMNGSDFSVIPRPSNVGTTMITFDNQNNLWTAWSQGSPGTYPGVAHFDGTNWYSHGTAGLNPISITIDSENNKWFGTSFGLWKYDDVTWTNYPTTYTSAYLSRTLTTDNAGNKWFSTVLSHPDFGIGIGKFDGNNWTAYNPSIPNMPGNSIYSLAIDNHGNKWVSGFATQGCGLAKFDGSSWDSIAPNYPTVSAVGRNDKIWFGTCAFDGTNWGPCSNPHNISPTAIAIDQAHNVWFADDGVYKFDGNTWQYFNNLAGNYITSIDVDQQNNKWFGTYTNGVSKFNESNWTSYNTANSGLADNSINAIATDNLGNIWFGTDSGVSMFNGSSWVTYNKANSGLAGDQVIAINIDKMNNKWFATRHSYQGVGVSKLSGSNWQTYTTYNSGLGNDLVYSIKVDNLNHIWFGTDGGLSELLSTDSIYSTWLQFSENICANNTIHLNSVVNYGTPPYNFAWQATGNALSCSNCQTPTASITQNSVYTVLVTDADNRVTADTLQVYACLNTAVNELENEIAANIYPNPAAGLLYVETAGEDVLALNIYDLQGRMAISFSHPTGQANDISHLSHGLYIAEILTPAGTARKRLVKM